MREVPTAILAIPDQWARVLHSTATQSMLIDTARLRDELHVVANRITRVLAAPGSAIVPAVRIETPTAWTRPTNADQLITLMRFAADRLAGVLDSLRPEDWNLTGRAGRTSMSVCDLALIPLHRSHRRLTSGGHAVEKS